MNLKTHEITPVAKPRMTRRDKWLSPPRPGVAKYWRFCDQIKANRVDLPKQGAHVTFIMPMPKSWSKKKKGLMCGEFHEQTPDLDNLLKALGDAVYSQDKDISDIHVSKIWGTRGAIIITAEK